MIKMSLEQTDHFLRHVRIHANELREGTFSKEKEYLEKLKSAQYTALEISHDIIHVLRLREFKGYENADFSFDVNLPENWKNHEFRKFDSQSFRLGCKLKRTLDMGLVDENSLKINIKELEEQMEILGNSIQDSEVLIKMLEEHFNK